MSEPILTDYLDECSLARELRVNRRTLIRWRDTGVGPAFVRIGRKVLYSRAAVADWLTHGGTAGANGRAAA